MTEMEQSRAKTIFFEAMDLPPEEREVYLANACGEDAELRREVESLLTHHDPVSIFSQAVVEDADQKNVVLEPAARSTIGKLRLSRLFGNRTRRRLWILAAAVALGGFGFWTHARIKGAHLDILESELTTVLSAEVHALDHWIEDQKAQAELLAEDPRLLPLVEELLAITNREETTSVVDALRRASARQGLLELSQSFEEKTQNNAGLVVLDERGLIVFVDGNTETGMALNATGFAYLSEVFAGRTVLLRPYRAGDLIGVYDTGTMYTYVFTPVRDALGQVLAVLATVNRAYGPHSISHILEVAQLGTTGETYAFDDDGLMLTASRSIEALREAGLAPSSVEEGREWDAGAQLNTQVRDPGGDLSRGHEPERELRARPLTKMAALAIAARDKPNPADRQGILLEPYRNYLGVEVIGAWQWLAENGFGVATEIEAREALAPLRYLDRIFGVLFALLSFFVATTLISTFSMARLRSRIRKLKELGPYRLVKRIAEGGMGSVYIAEHALLRRRTAVKILSGDLSKESVARFEREVRLTSRLTHPNTVEIYDYGQTPEGIFYYAMEYVEGPTLSELVARSGPLPPARAVHVLKQVCGSLGEAHREGLVHRDIKPQNIMLCKRGGRGDVVKVLDFGLVKELTKFGSYELTAGMQIGGTPLYMAPERVTAPKHLDARVDVYSLGAVAYYLQTGRPIFETANDQELLHMIMNDHPVRPSSVSPKMVPPELEELIMDCLAKDPKDRPQSVFAILDRLDQMSHLGTWTQEDALDWWEHRSIA